MPRPKAKKFIHKHLYCIQKTHRRVFSGYQVRLLRKAMETKRICIIGAGVSGLMACKYLLARGFLPVVFEADRTVGGVWRRTPASTRLQTVRWDYQFSDFQWPETVIEICPNHTQVMEYIESYAQRFDLLRHVRFGERVVSVAYVGVCEEEMEAWDLWGGTGTAFGAGGRGVWHVTVQRQDGSVEVHIMDFIILCIGRYNGLPNIPTFPENKGPEIFNGEVIHSMDYSNMDNSFAAHFVKGKRVIIVGYLKSALDIAAECSNINGHAYPCTMIVRSKRWNIAQLVAWGIPINYLYFNRFSELLLHKPGEGLIQSLMATFLSPLRLIFSKFTESYLLKSIPMKKYGMVPEHSFFEAVSSGLICALPESFYEKVNEGSIILKPCRSFEFCKNGIFTEGETTPLEADLVIYATGFKADQNIREIFVSSKFKKIVTGNEDTRTALYRECIHPQIPQMAIIGYSESASDLQISEMRARWLACLLDNGFVLPSRRSMEKNIMEWAKYFEKYSGNSSGSNRRSCFTPIRTWYNDQLCKDMGCNPRRKTGFFADLFIPYGPSDYTDLEFA